MRTLKYITILIFINSIVLAEEKVLTLEKALDCAVLNAFDVLSSKAEKRKLKHQINEAMGALLPSLKLESMYTRYDKATAFTFPDSNGDMQETVIRPKEDRTATVTASWNIDLFGVSRKGVSIARIAEQAAQENICTEISKVKVEVRKAYYNIRKTKAFLDIANKTKDNVFQRLERAKELKKNGSISEYSVTRFETEYQRAISDQISAKNSLVMAKSALNNLIAKPVHCNYSTEPIKEKITIPDVTLNDWICFAWTCRSEIKSLQKQIKAQSELTDFQKGGTTPSLELRGKFFRDFNPTFGSNPEQLSATAMLRWTIFDSGVTKAKVNAAKEDVNKVKIQLEKVKSAVALEIRQALVAVQNAKEQIKVAQKTVKFAKHGLKIAKVRYEVNEAYALEVTDAETEYTRAQRSLAVAKYDYLASLASLKRAIGTDDLEKVKSNEKS